MALLAQKVLENRRRQHALVTGHKRKIRDEVRPRLMQAKRSWYESSRESNRKIRERWHHQRTRVRAAQRDVKLRHKAKILAHRRRLRREMASRR
ncbi:Uncharacterised protein [uncultured archaeon]|nr:Uncharacterised protein [uncultured archaeon]